MKEQVPYARGGVDVVLPDVALEHGWVERHPGGTVERQSSSSAVTRRSGITVAHTSSMMKESPPSSSVPMELTPEVHIERERAASGLVRANPDVVARVVRNGLSARCRAVLDKYGPTGPEWYGTETWNKLRAQATARRLARAAVNAELQQGLRAVLETARRAYEIVVTGGPDEAFALQVRAARQHQESLRTRYALAFKMGDDKPLGLAVSQACGALFAVDSDLRNERDSAATLATAHETVVKYRDMRHLSVSTRSLADEAEQWLVRAQEEHEQARARLASRLEELGHTLAEATRVAADDRRPAGDASQPIHARDVP